MKPFAVDHDLHIHSQLSSCSSDPLQTPARILAYAEQFSLATVCVTDHFWDPAVPGASGWYRPQDYEHIKKSLPLPQSEKVRFLFGCETDMDKYFTIGISDKTLEELDFIIVPTTHLHMKGFTIDAEIGFDEDGIKRRRELYVERFRRLLAADLPFEKVGVAHLTCSLACANPARGILELLDGIPDQTFRELFSKAAKIGLGIELNFNPFEYSGADREIVFRPFRIAKECGCKFYLGSDAHHPGGLSEGIINNFKEIVSSLALTEDYKFLPA